MITISVANQKGGVGKSTAVAGISANLAKCGYRVLMIDADTQGNLTMLAGCDRSGSGLFDAVEGKTSIVHCLQKISDSLYLITGGENLKEIETKYATRAKKDKLYRKAFQGLERYFHYMIIDTSPFLGTSTLCSMSASDYCILPIQLDDFSVQGLGDMLEFVGDVKRRCNPSLEVLGVLESMFEPRSSTQCIYDELIRERAEKIGINVFKTQIRKSQTVRTGQNRKDLSVFTSKSLPGKNFGSLTQEILRITEKEN